MVDATVISVAVLAAAVDIGLDAGCRGVVAGGGVAGSHAGAVVRSGPATVFSALGNTRGRACGEKVMSTAMDKYKTCIKRTRAVDTCVMT